MVPEAMKKAATVGFLTTIFLSAFTSGIMNFGLAQSGTQVSGIIASDTTWTSANSPYSLSGNMQIDNGVTLTIESGATVNFYTRTLLVNGTLYIEPGATINLGASYITVKGLMVCRGSISNKVQINGASRVDMFPPPTVYSGIITFGAGAADWNEQTGTGCIIENTNIVSTAIIIQGCSPKIQYNSFSGTYAAGSYHDQAIISDSSPIINSNVFNISGQITLSGDNIVFSSNVYTGDNHNMLRVGEGVEVFNNTFTNGNMVLVQGGSEESKPWIHDNLIAFCTSGFQIQGRALIERNRITDNTNGLLFYDSYPVTIRNNTITRNILGILLGSPKESFAATIVYNNIAGNTQNSIRLQSTSNLDVPNNWWGTDDAQTISQTIKDYQDDPNLGKVNFTPFLTEPNPQAEPTTNPASIPNILPQPTQTNTTPSPNTTPTNTPKPTESPSPQLTLSPNPSATVNPSPTVPEFPGWILLPLPLVTALAAIIAAKRKKAN